LYGKTLAHAARSNPWKDAPKASLLLYDDYYIRVYPFVYAIESYDFILGKCFNFSHYYHHNDFIENKILYDPCDIYEKISGVKIHSNNEVEYDIYDNIVRNKNHKMYQEHQKQFEEYCINRTRKQKLKRILYDNLV
jgi:hypothetical protein